MQHCKLTRWARIKHNYPAIENILHTWGLVWIRWLGLAIGVSDGEMKPTEK